MEDPPYWRPTVPRVQVEPGIWLNEEDQIAFARARGERVEPFEVRRQRLAREEIAAGAALSTATAARLAGNTARRTARQGTHARLQPPVVVVERTTGTPPFNGLHHNDKEDQKYLDLKKHVRDLRHLVQHLEQTNKDLREDSADLHKHLSLAGLVEAEKRVQAREMAKSSRPQTFSRKEVFRDGESAEISSTRRRIKEFVAKEMKVKKPKRVSSTVANSPVMSTMTTRRPLQEIKVQQAFHNYPSTAERQSSSLCVTSIEAKNGEGSKTNSNDNQEDDRFAQLTKPSRLIDWTGEEGKEALKNQYHFLLRPILPLTSTTLVYSKSIEEIVWALKHQGVPVTTLDVTHLSGDGGEFCVEIDERYVDRMPQRDSPILKSFDNRSLERFNHRLPNFLVERLSWTRVASTKLTCKELPPGHVKLESSLQLNAALSRSTHVVIDRVVQKKRKREKEEEEDALSADVQVRWEKMARLETSREDIEVIKLPLKVYCSTSPATHPTLQCDFYQCSTCQGESDACKTTDGNCRWESYRKR